MTFQCAVIIISKWFETYPGVAQLGSALDWGSRGRRFKSCHSDHKKASEAFIYKGFGAFFYFYSAAVLQEKISLLWTGCGQKQNQLAAFFHSYGQVTDKRAAFYAQLTAFFDAIFDISLSSLSAGSARHCRAAKK